MVSWRYIIAIVIEPVPNRNSPPAILLRESYRDGAKIKKRTIANLSDWPTELVEGLRTLHELYAAIDWLGERQQAIEKVLARKHLRDGTLVLYDVSSSYLEGRCCELAKRARRK